MCVYVYVHMYMCTCVRVCVYKRPVTGEVSCTFKDIYNLQRSINMVLCVKLLYFSPQILHAHRV